MGGVGAAIDTLRTESEGFLSTFGVRRLRLFCPAPLLRAEGCSLEPTPLPLPTAEYEDEEGASLRDPPPTPPLLPPPVPLLPLRTAEVGDGWVLPADKGLRYRDTPLDGGLLLLMLLVDAGSRKVPFSICRCRASNSLSSLIHKIPKIKINKIAKRKVLARKSLTCYPLGEPRSVSCALV